jgi:phosphoglycolate phosphatase-like HAD superfamily hydrolase
MVRILALDFDGTLCDGMAEYWQTAWKTYQSIWPAPHPEPTAELEGQFRQLRPLIEVGWEMPLLIAALIEGKPISSLETTWPQTRERLLAAARLSASEIADRLDTIRDEWIDRDLAQWLSLHQFYPGTIEMLGSLRDRHIHPLIITTKEGRFVNQLLQRSGVDLPSDAIWGKECQRSKAASLGRLLAMSDVTEIWFVEDRLPTLWNIAQQPQLQAVKLYLADWGYNTAAERSAVVAQTRIQLLSLAQLPELGSG